METMLKQFFVLLGSLGIASTAWAQGDISHNWVSKGEAAAMQIFAAQYESLGGVWKETTFPQTEESIAAAKTRYLGGKPPMSLQLVLGGNTVDFGENGLLGNVNAAARKGNWQNLLPAGLNEIAQYNGNYVAAPVFVEVINFMYTNEDSLKKAGVAAPNNFDEFLASLPPLKKAGIVPIAVGGESWQEAILFDQVLLAVGGGDFYNQVVSGDLMALQSNEMLKALNYFSELRQYTDEGKVGRGWNDTNNLVVTGKAAYFFMGPWAKGGYDLQQEGKSWSCRLTPWGKAALTVTDGFLFLDVQSEAEKKAQILFAEALMNPETQFKAAKAKGSLPAIKGNADSNLGACARKASQGLSQRAIVSHWNARSVGLKSALKDFVTKMWNSSMTAEEGQEEFVRIIRSVE